MRMTGAEVGGVCIHSARMMGAETLFPEAGAVNICVEEMARIIQAKALFSRVAVAHICKGGKEMMGAKILISEVSTVWIHSARMMGAETLFPESGAAIISARERRR